MRRIHKFMTLFSQFRPFGPSLLPLLLPQDLPQYLPARTLWHRIEEFDPALEPLILGLAVLDVLIDRSAQLIV